jgi:hypothetical protein
MIYYRGKLEEELASLREFMVPSSKVYWNYLLELFISFFLIGKYYFFTFECIRCVIFIIFNIRMHLTIIQSIVKHNNIYECNNIYRSIIILHIIIILLL